MKIFVLTSRVPYPLEKGDKLRIYHQLKELSKTHDIYLCSLYSSNTNIVGAKEELLSFCKEVLFIKLSPWQQMLSIIKSCFNKLPFQSAIFYDQNAKRKVTSYIKQLNPDHIYCQLTRVAEYVKELSTPKTIDYMDCFSKGMKRRADRSNLFSSWLFSWEANKQANHEKNIYPYFDNHTIISTEDRNALALNETENVHIIPNGVDFDFFSPKAKEANYDLCFVGNMSYAPNVDAAQHLCKEILPLIKKKIPFVKILIAGASPNAKVRSLEAEGITVSGWMDDIRDAYSTTKVFIAPMRIGSGLQNKLLEAMAMNTACVTTPIANKSLGADETQILEGKSAKELAEHCILLLQDQALRKSIAIAGNKYVRNKYQWSKTSQELEQLFVD